MSIAEHLQRVKDLQSGMNNLFAEAVEITAFDLLEEVSSRIQGQGKKASGGSLKGYSASYLAFKKDPKGKSPATARKLGIASSRYTGKVDYTLTGRMWSSIKVMPVEVNRGRFVVTIGTKSKEAREKLRSLAKRDNHNPLEPSRDEIQVALQDMKINIQSKISRFL